MYFLHDPRLAHLGHALAHGSPPDLGHEAQVVLVELVETAHLAAFLECFPIYAL